MTMALCNVTSGPYRCLHEVDSNGVHPGACEAQAREYARRGHFVQVHGFWYDVCGTCKIVTEHREHGCSACHAKKVSQ